MISKTEFTLFIIFSCFILIITQLITIWTIDTRLYRTGKIDLFWHKFENCKTLKTDRERKIYLEGYQDGFNNKPQLKKEF